MLHIFEQQNTAYLRTAAIKEGQYCEASCQSFRNIGSELIPF